MIRLILLTVTIAALIGIIFFVLATVRFKNFKYGLLTFLWSFIFALFGSGIGFFLGWLWYKWTLRTDPSFSNPNLSGLSQGVMAGYLITVWFFCVQTGTILGGIWGGVRKSRYYQTRSKNI